jgi:hypothetical protein
MGRSKVRSWARSSFVADRSGQNETVTAVLRQSRFGGDVPGVWVRAGSRRIHGRQIGHRGSLTGSLWRRLADHDSDARA